MSVPYRTPLGVKIICLASLVDALLNVGKGISLVFEGDPRLPWVIAILLGVGIVAQSLWQLTTVYTLYMLKPSAYRTTLQALEAGLVIDVVGLFVGFSSPLDLVLTVGVILYLYARKDTFLPAGKTR